MPDNEIFLKQQNENHISQINPWNFTIIRNVFTKLFSSLMLPQSLMYMNSIQEYSGALFYTTAKPMHNSNTLLKKKKL